MLTCDWCDQAISGSQQTAYSIEAIPFRPLNISGTREGASKPVIVAETHLHEKCRESFLEAVDQMIEDHEPTEDELEYDHHAEEDEGDSTRDPGRELFWRRHDEWRALPRHEQGRMVLEALADERLTNREIEERLLEHEDRPHPNGVSGEVAAITRRLLEAEEVQRQEGRFGMSRFRYCRTGLAGAIKDLDDAFGAVAYDGQEG